MEDMNMGAMPPAGVTDDDKLWALLSWIFAPLVGAVMLLMEEKKTRPFIKYNAIQSIALGLVGYVLSSILAPVLGIGCFTGIAVLVYSIILAVNSYKGQWVTIPFVTDFCIKQGWIDPAPMA